MKLMKSIYFSVLFLIALTSNAVIGQGVVFDTDTYENMLEKAKADGKPIMVVFGFKECSICNQMDRETYSDVNVGNFVNQNMHSYKVDAFGFDGIGTTQLLNVTQFPSVLVFNVHGEKIGIIKGFFNPDNFIGEASRILSTIPSKNGITVAVKVPEIKMATPTMDEKEYNEQLGIVMRNAEEVQNSSTDIVQSVEAAFASKSGAAAEMEMETEAFEKIDANLFLFGDVPGIMKYSVKDKKPGGYGLKVGQFNSLEALKSELKEYEKGWKAEIWVYSQARSTTKIYCLALGLYDDKEQAYYMRKLLYNTFFIQSTVVKLDDIRYEK